MMTTPTNSLPCDRCSGIMLERNPGYYSCDCGRWVVGQDLERMLLVEHQAAQIVTLQNMLKVSVAMKDKRYKELELQRQLSQAHTARIVELEQRLADDDQAYKATINEQCAQDEHHCACVPHMRRRIAELEREARLPPVYDWNGQYLSQGAVNALIAQNQRIKSHNDALKARVAEFEGEVAMLRGDEPDNPNASFAEFSSHQLAQIAQAMNIDPEDLKQQKVVQDDKKDGGL